MIDINSLTLFSSIVFSSSFFPRQRRRCCQRCQHRPTLIPCHPWWSPYCHSTTRCCRPEGEDCQCSTKQHSRRWRRWFQQHHAAYVIPPGVELEAYTNTPLQDFTPMSRLVSRSTPSSSLFSLLSLSSALLLFTVCFPSPSHEVSNTCILTQFPSYRQDYPKVLQLNGLQNKFQIFHDEEGRSSKRKGER